MHSQLFKKHGSAPLDCGSALGGPPGWPGSDGCPNWPQDWHALCQHCAAAHSQRQRGFADNVARRACDRRRRRRRCESPSWHTLTVHLYALAYSLSQVLVPKPQEPRDQARDDRGCGCAKHSKARGPQAGPRRGQRASQRHSSAETAL
jgi:hypothetical protein